MRMDSLASQGRRGPRAPGHVLLQKIAHTEPRDRGAALVEEEVLIDGIHTGSALLDQVLQQLRSPRPYRADAHLVALPREPDLAGRLKPNVASSKIDDLLDPRTGVEHQREQSVVAPSARCS